MGRLPRIYLPGYPLHIIQRGNNRHSLFHDAADYRRCFGMLRAASARFDIRVHAYVLMTNHFHLLATPSNVGNLGRMMQSMGIRYVQYYNAKYSRTGTLWEGRFKSTLVDSESYFLTCSRYIELNPVRAGLVRNPVDYSWSSYRFNAMGIPDALSEKHEIYAQLGTTPSECESAYRAMFCTEISQADLAAIRLCTQRSWVLGHQALCEAVLAQTGRRPYPGSRGRKKGWRKQDSLNLSTQEPPPR